MTKEEIKNLIGEYDMFVNTFRYAKFVVDGNAKKVHDLLEELTHDELILEEKDC